MNNKRRKSIEKIISVQQANPALFEFIATNFKFNK